MTILPFLLLAAGSLAASTENIHERPIITANYYDPNYHDDGRSRLLRGPTAASSSSTLSVMNPYAASASSHGHYNRPPPPPPPPSSSEGGGGIMAIVDHYYGPDGEEKVQYKSTSEMDKEELDQILSSLGSAKLSREPPPPPPPQHVMPPSMSGGKNPFSFPPPPPPKSFPSHSPPSVSYGGPPPPSSSNPYKSSSSPSSYTATSQGFSLPSLYKSSAEMYSKPPPPQSSYRPAFSTIYKDPPYSSIASSPGKSPYSKGLSEYVPPKEPHYASSYKEQSPIHSPKELSFMRGPPYFLNDSPPPQPPPSPPKSISDSILLSEGYKSYAPPPPKGITNVIDHDEGPNFYSHPPSSYAPPPSSPALAHSHHSSPPPPSPPHHMPPHLSTHESPYHHHHHPSNDEFPMSGGKLYSPSVHLLKDEYSSFGKEPSKPAPHSVSLKYSSPDLNIPPPPSHTVHPNGYTSGFAPGFPSEDSDPYSRPGSSKGYSERPPQYSSSSPPLGGHSLSSLYEPSTFEKLYNSPKSQYASPPKAVFAASSSGSKPTFGPPPGIYGSHSYGSPVEYHMGPKGFVTSSSPYSSPLGGGPVATPKYKGPYRTVSTGPSGSYASYGYGYGKPHYFFTNHLHGNNLLASSSNLITDMFSWYKTRGGGWARRPPMMKQTPYYKYKYSTLSHSNIHMHPFEYENGPSEKYYWRRNRFSRFPFIF